MPYLIIKVHPTSIPCSKPKERRDRDDHQQILSFVYDQRKLLEECHGVLRGIQCYVLKYEERMQCAIRFLDVD
jgi:hypothetical protein